MVDCSESDVFDVWLEKSSLASVCDVSPSSVVSRLSWPFDDVVSLSNSVNLELLLVTRLDVPLELLVCHCWDELPVFDHENASEEGELSSSHELATAELLHGNELDVLLLFPFPSPFPEVSSSSLFTISYLSLPDKFAKQYMLTTAIANTVSNLILLSMNICIAC